MAKQQIAVVAKETKDKAFSIWNAKINEFLGNPSPQISKEESPMNYWKIYFDFGYHLLLVPFRFKLDERRNYKIHTSSVHKIGCALVWGSVLFQLIKTMWKLHKSDLGSYPSFYLECSTYLGQYTCLGLMMIVFWSSKGQGKISQVFKEVQENRPKFLHKYKDGGKVNLITHSLCLLYLLLCAGRSLDILEDHGWSLKNLYRFHEEGARMLCVTFFSYEKLDPIPPAFVLVVFLADLLDTLLYLFCDLFFIQTVLIFNATINEFVQTLSQVSNSCHVLEHYNWVKQITNGMNDAVGLAIIGYFLSALPFYSQMVPTLMSSAGYVKKIRYIIYVLIYFNTILRAAIANQRMDNLKKWLCKEENYDRIPPVKVILHELQMSCVSLSANGCFNMTYSFMGTIVNLTITYAVITVQFSSSSGLAIPE